MQRTLSPLVLIVPNRLSNLRNSYQTLRKVSYHENIYNTFRLLSKNPFPHDLIQLSSWTMATNITIVMTSVAIVLIACRTLFLNKPKSLSKSITSPRENSYRS